jgi:uncharacterized protein involved in response to NO
MIFIPTWITNVLLLVSCVMANFQHWRLKRENPFTNLQVGIVVFSLAMVVVVVLYNLWHRDPWVSLAFFLIAVAVFCVTFRQFRTLPRLNID